jgi:sulfotransferase family protein
MVYPFVLIVGCPRSGTTLLQRIVAAHPDIAVTFETHWIQDLLEEPGYPRALPAPGLRVRSSRTRTTFAKQGSL